MKLSADFQKNRIKDYFLLLLLAAIAYWPVSFMVFSVKNDAINYFLAMRYNIGESIQHGYFPFWTPYINLGYPLHGDMQSGVWNPIVLLLSSIREYDIYQVHAETILAIFIGGTGMYELLKYLGFERITMLAIGVAYMLNGYMVDSGQFLNWLYAASFLPFVFLCTLRSLSSFSIKDAFLLGVSLSLMFLCAYPADFIILSYIVLAFIIVSFIKLTKTHSFKKSLNLHFTQSAVTLVSFLLICLPAIFSYIPFLQLIDRGSGISLDLALSNSYTPANFISFLTPWATLKGAAFSVTDPLVRSCYIGILPLLFFLYTILEKKPKTFVQKFLIAIFIIAVVFSLGELGGLRTISYYVLPLMNTFRHPANAKLFFIFAAQLLAAFTLNKFIKGEVLNTKMFKTIFFSILLISGLAILYSLYSSNVSGVLRSNMTSENKSTGIFLKTIRDSFSFSDLLLLNSSIVVFISLLILVLHKKDKLRKYIVPVIFLDMFIIAQGMIPLTYVSTTTTTEVQKILSTQPKGYPLPDIHESIQKNSKDGMTYFNQVGCLNPFNKKLGRSDYIISPANLKSQELFWDYYPLRNKIIELPIAYFADTIYRVSDTSVFIKKHTAGVAVIANTQLPVSFKYYNNNLNTIVFKKLTPNYFEFEISAIDSSFFVFHQNYYPDCEVKVNNKKEKIIVSNLTFSGVWVPPGKSTIVFNYNVNYLKWLGIFSLLFLITGLIYFSFKKNNFEKRCY